jgi:hypothetical protein
MGAFRAPPSDQALMLTSAEDFGGGGYAAAFQT